MSTDFENGKAKMEDLLAWASEHAPGSQRNEATTRLHLIDRLLFECLGWDRADGAAEDRYERTYADYSLGRPFRQFLVEAKKEGVYFDLPAGFDRRTCALRTVMESAPSVDKAVRQAVEYCQTRGVAVGAVCNGHQLIAFLGSRQDGIPPLEGRCLVFQGLEDMSASFRELWDNLSKPAIAVRNLHANLRADAVKPPPEKLSQRLPDYPGFKNRNPFQTELSILGGLFVEDVAHAPQS